MGLGLSELFVLLIIAIALLGPDKIPEFAKLIGRYWYKYQKWREMLNREISREISPIKDSVEEITHSVKTPVEELKKVNTDNSHISDDLRKLAIELGIDVEGKSRSEIYEEIKQRVKGLDGD